MTKMKKGAFCTDIHFGKKSNSRKHNEDCIHFLEWFSARVKKLGDIDYIGFLGDWNENRSAINIETLNFSYQGAKILNDIGLPVYFLIGNHDLHHRNNRDIHSVIPYQELENFNIIAEPTIVEEIGEGMLWCPYMLAHEYPSHSILDSVPDIADEISLDSSIVNSLRSYFSEK